MFYKRRIEELERQVSHLELELRLSKMEGKIHTLWREIPIKEMMFMILSHLGLSIEHEPDRVFLKKTQSITNKKAPRK